jgi:hypothetical protein
MFNRIEVGGVRRQEFLGTAHAFDELASFGRLVEAGIIVDHTLSRFEDRPQTPLSRCLEEGSRARALEHERGNKSLVGERIDETHPLCAIARLLPPARFASRTPATTAGSMVIHAGLIQIYELLKRNHCHLLAKLLSQDFVAFDIPEGLFLCV